MVDDQEQIERVLDTMIRTYERHAFGTDKARADDLRRQARPAVEALMARDNAYHEGKAMVTLLGRRMGNLDISPLSMSYVLPSLIDCLKTESVSLSPEVQKELLGMCTEGYVRAIQERLREASMASAAAAVPIIHPIPGCAALILSGELDSDTAVAIADRFGRVLLKKDAKSAIVDVSRVLSAEVRLAATQTACDAARMLGVLCVVVISPLHQEEFADLDVDIYVKFADALRAACRAEGILLRSLPKMMRRFT